MVVEDLGSRRGGPIIKIGQVDLVESLGQNVRERMGQEIRVDQNSSGEVNKFDRVSSNDHNVTSARNDTWVIVVSHQDAIIVGKLAI